MTNLFWGLWVVIVRLVEITAQICKLFPGADCITQSAIAIAREAFDELNGVSDHRITFHAQFLQRDRLNEPPVRLMDAVWGQLANKPPKYIRVRIKETPKDKSEGESGRGLPRSVG